MSRAEAWQVSRSAAEIYEQDFVPALFSHWPEKIIEEAELHPGQRVLDVACGTGLLARTAAERVNPGGQVTGLDLNEGMLEVARRFRPDLDWRQGDATALPFADAIFDRVLCQFGLMFFGDRPGALRQMWRVLAPDGRLALAVWAPIAQAPAEALLLDILRRRVGEEAAAMLEAPFVLGEVPLLLQLFQDADIPRPELDTREGEARFASLEEFLRIEIMGTPLAEMVSEAQYRQILEDARQELAAFVKPDGGFAFPLEARVVTAAKG